MNDAKDEAINKLTKAIVALGIAVLLLSLVLSLFSFTRKYLPTPVSDVFGFEIKTEIPEREISESERLFTENIDMAQGELLFKQNCSNCHSLPPVKCGMEFETIFKRRRLSPHCTEL